MAQVTSDPLVSPDWLRAHLVDPDLAILDASWFLPGGELDPEDEFTKGHIPGALRFRIDEICDRTSPLPHMLPSSAAFAEAVSAMGIGADTTVVIYDSLGLFSSPRVWWTFRVMGCNNVHVLDGGLPGWVSRGFPLATGAARPRPPKRFPPRFNEALVRDLEQVRDALATGAAQIVDARPRARFTGAASEPRPGVRAGHMPGALNLPYADVIEGERLAGADRLRSVFESSGVALDRPIITTCGSGVSAAVLALALASIGRRDVAVYDGSWSEWGARADTPVVQGTSP